MLNALRGSNYDSKEKSGFPERAKLALKERRYSYFQPRVFCGITQRKKGENFVKGFADQAFKNYHNLPEADNRAH
jgi:hypothetical protein